MNDRLCESFIDRQQDSEAENMTAVVRGTRAQHPGESVTVLVEVGQPVPADLTITEIVAVAGNSVDVLMQSLQIGEPA